MLVSADRSSSAPHVGAGSRPEDRMIGASHRRWLSQITRAGEDPFHPIVPPRLAVLGGVGPPARLVSGASSMTLIHNDEVEIVLRVVPEETEGVTAVGESLVRSEEGRG